MEVRARSSGSRKDFRLQYAWINGANDTKSEEKVLNVLNTRRMAEIKGWTTPGYGYKNVALSGQSNLEQYSKLSDTLSLACGAF